MNYEEIIEFLIKEVEKKINEKNKIEKNSVLVVINGGNANVAEILAELENLSKTYKVEVVYSKKGKVLLYDKVSKILVNEREVTYENTDEILTKNSVVLLPFLTKNSAAKIAYGIRDTEITYLVSKAIFSNKKIIAAYNSCRISGESKYIDQFKLNIEKLKTYGIFFAEGKELEKTVKSLFSNDRIYFLDKEIVTFKDLNILRDVEIVVGNKTKITNLVLDKSRELNIRFIKEQ